MFNNTNTMDIVRKWEVVHVIIHHVLTRKSAFIMSIFINVKFGFFFYLSFFYAICLTRNNSAMSRMVYLS